MMMSLGMGMAVSNAVGVVEALCGRSTSFIRTPKRGDAGSGAFYFTRLRPAAAAEAALLLYFALALVWCATTRLWAALQNASGGTWGGCVFDPDAILRALSAGTKL